MEVRKDTESSMEKLKLTNKPKMPFNGYKRDVKFPPRSWKKNPKI
jgi:hypothetical protein